MDIGTLYSSLMTENTFKKSRSISTHALRIRWAAIGAAIAVSLGGGVTLFAQAGAAPASSSTFVAVSPVRVLDTRDAVVLWAGPFVTGVPHDVKVTGSIPTSAGAQLVMPVGATGVVLNVTVVNSTADGFVSVRPADAVGDPKTSNINFEAGKTVANSITVNLPTSGADAGTFEVWFDSMGVAGATADILVDVTGYYSASALDLKSDAIAIIGSGGEDFGDIQLDGVSQGFYWTGYDWLFLSRDYVNHTFHAFTTSVCSGKAFANYDGLVMRDGVGTFFETKDGGDVVTLANNAFRSVLDGGSCYPVTPADFLPGVTPAEDGPYWWYSDAEPMDILFYEAQVVGVASEQVNAIWAHVSGQNYGINEFSFVPRSSLNAAG